MAATFKYPRRTISGLARFWAKVRIVPGECWVWIGAKVPTGYGSFGDYSGHTIKAHRYAYIVCVGPIPRGKVVMHTCDNRACVNPDHLRVGTQLENIADSVLKNRRGMVLCPEQVREIRRRAALGETQKSIGRRFGIGQASAGRVINRVNWGHIQ